MSEPSSPVPEQPPAQKNVLIRAVRAVGGGLACLGVLLALAIIAVVVLGLVSAEPTFALALAAFIVAMAALKESKRRRQ